MRLLFLSAQVAAHLDWGGYLATAVALAQRGHTVTWASGAALAPHIARAGLRFAPLAETGWRWPPPPPLDPHAFPNPDEYQAQRALRALDQWLDPARVGAAAHAIAALIARTQADAVVSEMFVAAAGLAAEAAGQPLVVAGWPAHRPATEVAADAAPGRANLVQVARARLDGLLGDFGLSGVNFQRAGAPALLSPRLHVTYWGPSWFAGADLLPQTQHAGGRAPVPLPPDPGLPPPDERPWVFVTLGTNFGGDEAFFANAAQAAARLGCVPVTALGALANGARARLAARLPRAAALRDVVDFRAVLPYCAAAIHHGGAGTAHALALHGVPQVVVPHAADQERQALGVRRSGVGVALAAREATEARLETALAALLPDRSVFRACAQAVQAEFAALGGIPRAAELIEGIV